MKPEFGWSKLYAGESPGPWLSTALIASSLFPTQSHHAVFVTRVAQVSLNSMLYVSVRKNKSVFEMLLEYLKIYPGY